MLIGWKPRRWQGGFLPLRARLGVAVTPCQAHAPEHLPGLRVCDCCARRRGAAQARRRLRRWCARQQEHGVANETLDRTLVKAAMRAPYLEREEEHDLAVRWKEDHDQQALHRITTSHMRLVISMASKFRHFGLSMGDLIQEGHVGLLEAAARFEPERDVRFSTYATWWIRASIQDYILRNWSIVRGGTSSAQKALFFNLRRLRARLAQGSETLSNESIYSEISAALGVSRADVALMD
jgi:RNA polymerase sigma factor (sigma-70 family)